MDLRRIALAFLLFFIFSVHGKPTKTPAVTFPGPVRTTPGPDSAGANNTMYRVVLPLFIVLLIAAAIIIFCYYRAWRRREQKQARDLQMVRVEKPVVKTPAVPTKKENIRPAKEKIKKATTIIEQLKAAKREEKKIRKMTSKVEEKKIAKITSEKEEEEITKRPSRLKRFRKWIKISTQEKNKGKKKERTNHLCCCTCRSVD